LSSYAVAEIQLAFFLMTELEARNRISDLSGVRVYDDKLS